MVKTKKVLPPTIIKYRGLFDFQKLSSEVYGWLKNEEYDTHEKKYKHKIPDARGAKEEITITAYKKINAYVMFYVDVDYVIQEMKSVEVIKDGKKQKMIDGRIKIMLLPSIVLDYSNRFSGNQFFIALQDFYHRFIIKQDIENYWGDSHHYRIYKLHTLIKKILGMESSTNAYEGDW